VSTPLQTTRGEAEGERSNDTSYPPTCRAVVQHAQRIQDVDLAYPIILSADGHVMDGMHRVAKAWMLGQSTITAVQFEHDPPPDLAE
jgi:hypothetical protein